MLNMLQSFLYFPTIFWTLQHKQNFMLLYYMCLFGKQKYFCRLLFKKQTVDKPKSMMYYSFYELCSIDIHFSYIPNKDYGLSYINIILL